MPTLQLLTDAHIQRLRSTRFQDTHSPPPSDEELGVPLLTSTTAKPMTLVCAAVRAAAVGVFGATRVVARRVCDLLVRGLHAAWALIPKATQSTQVAKNYEAVATTDTTSPQSFPSASADDLALVNANVSVRTISRIRCL